MRKIIDVFIILMLILFFSGCLSSPAQSQSQIQSQQQPKQEQIITPMVASTPKITAIPTPIVKQIPKKYNISFSTYDTNLIVEIPSNLISTNLSFECKNYSKNTSYSFDNTKVKVYEFQNISCQNKDGIVKYNNNKINFIIPNNTVKTMVIEQ